eukprot:gnl/MRDRNA2_/MRDRNA2_27320_c0_seq1.p1 gnl/MRDRNA2_/MRDRNA2_27320_c0~~gnl/MRDRNA2_/MRDRNA2_27320_c0_seq1.p1  ORF type:complete len:386 (-),score=78.25 gnl/MRDRNA2_/MRDRNA2_27320_c0_seq1:601-1662(-)
MLATMQNCTSAVLESQYEGECKGHLAQTFMESVEALVTNKLHEMSIPAPPGLVPDSDALSNIPQPHFVFPPPPGLGIDSDALTVIPQPGFEFPPPPGLVEAYDMLAVLPEAGCNGTMADVDKILGSLERHLSETSQKFLLRNDDAGESLFADDYAFGERSKLAPSRCSTLSDVSEELSLDLQTSSPYPSFFAEEDSFVSPRPESPATSFEDEEPVPCTLVDQCLVPGHALDALQKLKEMVEDQHLKREDLMTDEITGQLYPYIPFDDEGNLTSLGSILHAHGACQPCIFMKRDRCHKKDLCLYCHHPHEKHEMNTGIKRNRKAKSRRMKLRQECQQHQRSEDIPGPQLGAPLK